MTRSLILYKSTAKCYRSQIARKCVRISLKYKIIKMENCKQKLEILSLLDEPFADQYTLLDLLYNIWNSTYSGTKNLRLILASISKYLINRKNIDTRRMREGCDMKITLKETFKMWLKNDPMNPTCSMDEMYNFIRVHIPHKVSSFVNDVMTEKTFNEWIQDYKEYIMNLPVNAEDTSASRTISTMMDPGLVTMTQPRMDHSADKRCKGGKKGYGQDMSFNRTSAQDVSPVNRISQYVRKLKNGRWSNMECPGKIGSQLISLHVYDVRNRNKRPLTEKQRYRFFCSSRTDCKRKLLRQLLDQVEDDLKKDPEIKVGKKSRKMKN